MTERSLLIRCAAVDRYFAAGMDFPSARVFDVATGTLVSVVEIPPKQRASLAVLSLTALALGIVGDPDLPQEKRRVKKYAQSNSEKLSSCYAAVALSNGTVLLHNVSKNELVQHIAVSDTQHSITAVTFCGHYLFCLAANRMLHVLDCHSGERVATNLRVQNEAGTIAVTLDSQENAPSRHELKMSNGEDSVTLNFRVFVTGPTNAVYTLCLPKNRSLATSTTSPYTLERLVCFASQATSANFAWIGAANTSDSLVVITASAQEGVVRVWDASPATDSVTATTRCRRTLLCGQRIMHVDVREAEAMVIAATFTGEVLVWDLGRALLSAVADPVPTPPTWRIISQDNGGRLLFASFVPGSGEAAEETAALLLLRGRFATPCFEVLSLREAREKATPMASDGTAVYTVPSLGSKEDITEADAAMEVMDNVWDTHYQQQEKQMRKRQIELATRAIQTTTEAFVKPVTFHARSVKDLPQRSLTLEQKLRQLSRTAPTSLQQTDPSESQHHALGLATVPLYQALHANDASAVMELLTIASRSASDVRATVMGLQMPYCLQLLQILVERLRGANSRSPLFEWIDAIIHYRGVEMYHAQKQFKEDKTTCPHNSSNDNNDNNNKVIDNKNNDNITSHQTAPSPPKDFVAPLLHQYRNMTALYDSLSTMYGRLSIFKSVRPSEKSVLVNSNTGIIFPAMFTEIRCAGGGYRTLRVRSKADLNQNKKKSSRALLRTARRKAAAAVDGEKNAASDVEDDDEDDEDLDLDALDKMNLDEDDSTEEEEEDDEDDEDEEENETGLSKKKRVRTEKMLAEPERGSSYGVESSERSSEAEFEEASDDEVLSAANEEEEEEDEEDEEDSDDDEDDEDVVGELDEEDDEDEDDDEDDGMGEDMAELLAAHGEADKLEQRRHKRLRIDK